MSTRNSSSRPTDSEKFSQSPVTKSPRSSKNQSVRQSLIKKSNSTHKKDNYGEDKTDTTLNIKFGAPVIMITWDTIWKIVLVTYILNALCIIYDIMLMIQGIQTQVKVGDFINMVSDGDGTAIPVVLFLAGFFCFPTNVALIVVAWYTCSKHRNRLMNTIHFSLIIVLILLVLLLIALAIFCVVHAHSSLTDRLHYGILDAMKSYKNDTKMKMRLDILQITFQCCGSKTYSEWFDIPWFHTSDTNVESNQITRDDAPFSCCSQLSRYPCIHHDLMSVGSSYLYAPETNLSVSEHGCHFVLMRHTRTVAWHACFGLVFLALLLAGLGVAHRFLQTAHVEKYRYEQNSHWHTAWLFGKYIRRKSKTPPRPPPIPDELTY